MTVIRVDNDGTERVRCDPDEYPPIGDGYDYTLVGSSGDGGMLYKRRLSAYQNAPLQPPQQAPRRTQGGYGTMSASTVESRGGTVSPNASKYFPTAAALDMTAYYGSPWIDETNLESLLAKLPSLLGAISTSVTETATVLGAATSSTVRSLVSGGEGTSIAEEREVRQKIMPFVEDPRVVHYLALHGQADVVQGAGSLIVSKLTAGISSMVENSGAALDLGALATELKVLQGTLQEAFDAEYKKAHSADDLKKLDWQELIDAIGALTLHYGGAATMAGLKAIPFYVGTGMGIFQKIARVAGSIDSPKAACVTIQKWARNGHAGALGVCDLLGIPREVACAKGGEKAMYGRL
jgi:hypothetical protein